MTLVELLIVVAIFAMLATVGVIQLLRARMTAQEQFAVTNLRTVAKACQFYFLTNQAYPPDLVTLGPTISTPPYLDPNLAQDPANRQGYQFTYVPNPSFVAFQLRANPITHGVTGNRHYLTDETNTVYYTDLNQDAQVTDQVLP